MGSMSPEYRAAYYQKHKDRLKQMQKDRYAENADEINAKAKVKRSENPEKSRETLKRSRRKHAHRVNAKNAAYRASKAKGSLLSGDEWNDFFIEECYHIAQIRSKQTCLIWHVDHIVPINGKTVCGFHVWYNLQVIPAQMNFEKNNLLLDD